jgi:SPP1 gp7 family putative phage head morphogenesis protein
MRQATREAVKKKFGGKRLLISRVTPHYPQSLEREYVRLINSCMALFKNTLAEYLPDICAALERNGNGDLRLDTADDESETPTRRTWTEIAAADTAVENVFADVLNDFGKRQGLFGLRNRIEKLTKLTRKLTIAEWKRVVKRTLGIDIMADYYNGLKFQRLLDKWIADNVGLIKTIPQDTLGKMRDIVKQGYLNGSPVMQRGFVIQRKMKDGTVKAVTLRSKQKTIAEQIQDAYNISKSHAQLIARDQIAKLNAQITQEQMTDAGVTEYVWRTMDDRRVRDGHRVLNNKRFKFTEPPVVDKKTGRRANPGGDYQCRCVPLPVFDLDTVTLPWEKAR